MSAAAASDASWLNGRRVLAISVGHDLIGPVIDGLADLGGKVLRIGGELDLASRATVAAGIGAAIDRQGVPELVMLNVIPEAAMRVVALTAAAERDWRGAALEGLRTTVRILQALAPHLKAQGAAVAFVAPSLSLVGTAGMVALATLLEGQRGLMKSVARQWGAFGITLNWIAASPRALGRFEGASLASKPDAVTVALGRAPDPRREIASLLGYLGSRPGRAITGATLMLDGGEWMVP